jgi:hypothetical protein
MIAVLGIASLEAKEIRLIKKNGKPCKGDKENICYDKIYIRNTEYAHQQACENPGFEKCPKVSIVTVGGLANFDFEGLVVNVESEIIRGETKKKESFLTVKDNQLHTTYGMVELMTMTLLSMKSNYLT